MVELILSDLKSPLYLSKRYETDMAEGLKMMALEGHGIAFLPESSVIRELRYKQLALADGGESAWSLDMEIRLYRERPTAQRAGKPIVDRLWNHLLQLQLASQPKTADKSKAEADSASDPASVSTPVSSPASGPVSVSGSIIAAGLNGRKVAAPVAAARRSRARKPL